jgi:hypothetical protein
MGKVGRFVIDPEAGAYCQIVLGSGEKIIVTHDSKDGRLTIEVSRFMGFVSTRIFACALDSAEGTVALAALMRHASGTSIGATPLGALVLYVMDCRSVDEVKTRCAMLLAG